MKRFNFYAGLFIVTAATLMLQLIQTRILSVVAWYHLAFFVISMAMFGLTAGAVWIYLRGDRYTEKTLSFDLAHYSTAFGVTAALGLAFQMTLVPTQQLAITTFLIWLQLALFLAVPFFFSGIVVSLALTRSPYPVGRVYGVDLLGAAVGCFGVLLLLNTCSGPSAVLWTAALAALGALFFARSGIGVDPQPVPALAKVLRWHTVWFVVLVLAAALNTVDSRRLGLYPVFAKGSIQLETLPWFEKWNSFSRVIALNPSPPRATPQMWGPSPTFVASDWPISQSLMNIDGDAGTTAYGIGGVLAKAGFLKYDVTNLAYYLPQRKKGAVIGVGGGRDLISARVFGVPEVVGVEINPVFVDLHLQEPRFSKYVGLGQIDGVSLVVDEARSWFARTDQTFDIVQMSLIDTWAATGAGAFTLSENGLYTLEAWQIFLRRLNPHGVYTVSRWYSPDDLAETGRMVSLGVAALMKLGVTNPQNHVFLAGSTSFEGTRRPIATLVISPTGFSAEELQALKDAIAKMKFDHLIVPGESAASEALGRIMNARNIFELASYTRGFRLDLSPPTDDRPFFFNQLPFQDAAEVVALALSGRTAGVGSGNIYATVTLFVLFLIALGLVIAAIVVPLRPALRDVGRRLATGGTAFFMLIGIGFMLIEIGLLQRFSIFLGHPIYSLSIVLFSLILSTGVGSLVSDYVRIDQKKRFVVWAAATGAYVLSQVFWVPPLLLSLDSGSLFMRGLIAVAVIAPAGLLMGFGFPAGMRFISAVDRKPTPWFWGINGASGVLASAVAVGCSIAYGISTTLALGAICYFLLIPAAWVIGFPRATAARDEPT
ncbi:MAG TPA: hypothetical protein VNA44_01150 [Burkholderiaceae bacterium]|nr:hypothetical protein [Burkholderiaceae bacterium]